MTEDYKKQIVDLYAEYGTYAKVKEILGCSWDSICQATKEAGVNKGIGGNNTRMLPDSKYIELANAGMTVKEISKELGVYNSTVIKRLQKLDISPLFINPKKAFDLGVKEVKEWTNGKFEFVSKYTQKGTVYYLVRCANCGAEFGRAKPGIRDRNIRCPNCYRPKCQVYLRRLEQADHKKAELAKTKKCVICGSEFHNSDERRKTCSADCAAVLKEANHGLKRFRHKGGKVIDYGITLRRVYERDKGLCWICGKKTDFSDVLYTKAGHKYCGDSHPVKDHLIPLAHGGDESWENVRLACWRCNKIKSDAIVDVEETEKGKRLVVSERCGKKNGAIPVSQYSLDGNLIKTYCSESQASKETGIPRCQINAARVGRQQTAHGFVWKCANSAATGKKQGE